MRLTFGKEIQVGKPAKQVDITSFMEFT